jgi:hypothetical protein
MDGWAGVGQRLQNGGGWVSATCKQGCWKSGVHQGSCSSCNNPYSSNNHTAAAWQPPAASTSSCSCSCSRQLPTLSADAQAAGAHALDLGVGTHGPGDEGIMLDGILVQPLQVVSLRQQQAGAAAGRGTRGQSATVSGCGRLVCCGVYGFTSSKCLQTYLRHNAQPAPAPAPASLGPPSCSAPCSCPSGPPSCRRG